MSALMEDIREAVLAVLPSLPEDKVQSLLNKLASIGVESKSDLQFIKEEDLLANITPIQCRRLLNAWQTQDQTSYVTLTPVDHSDIVLSTTTEDPPSSESDNTSMSSSNTSRMTVNLSVWHENFSVPWNRMPPGIITAIALEKRPSAKDRRQMVFSTAADVERTKPLPESPRLIVLEEASSTLEFIQRCFIGINPTSGTKMTKWISPRSGKVHEKRNNSVSLHVSALLKRLMDFEWL
ncbi:hypothetical protein D5F01_LYC10655 [Larimichthys crocea]|uniref:Uncharacterized protein n=1 Tax=Larimichthys crocea TaxID=215358 RepID=A0A6G0IIH6_LARCR|nr:hypothetical protein D5F01_LYC10654 [Larimichthys crocea]KAE8291061.1 hypothetical protein D5F01_LYC10655 [Larimichthys crocea]